MFPSLSGIACKSLPNPHRVGICEGTFPKSPFYVWEQPRYVYLFSYHLPFWRSKIFHSWLWNNFTILYYSSSSNSSSDFIKFTCDISFSVIVNVNFVDEFVVDINFKLNNRKAMYRKFARLESVLDDWWTPNRGLHVYRWNIFLIHRFFIALSFTKILYYLIHFRIRILLLVNMILY